MFMRPIYSSEGSSTIPAFYDTSTHQTVDYAYGTMDTAAILDRTYLLMASFLLMLAQFITSTNIAQEMHKNKEDTKGKPFLMLHRPMLPQFPVNQF